MIIIDYQEMDIATILIVNKALGIIKDWSRSVDVTAKKCVCFDTDLVIPSCMTCILYHIIV